MSPRVRGSTYSTQLQPRFWGKGVAGTPQNLRLSSPKPATKSAPQLAKALRLPQNVRSTLRKSCACHEIRIPASRKCRTCHAIQTSRSLRVAATCGPGAEPAPQPHRARAEVETKAADIDAGPRNLRVPTTVGRAPSPRAPHPRRARAKRSPTRRLVMFSRTRSYFLHLICAQNYLL